MAVNQVHQAALRETDSSIETGRAVNWNNLNECGKKIVARRWIVLHVLCRCPRFPVYEPPHNQPLKSKHWKILPRIVQN